MATRTIKASGGDYSSLSAWHAALPSTLTEPEIAVCDAFEDTTAVTLSKVTSAANYMEVRAAAGHQHTFTRGTGYRVVTTSGSAITIQHNYIRLIGLAVKTSAASQDGVIAMSGSISATSDIRLIKMFAFDCAQDGFHLGSGTIKLVNSADVGAGRQGWSSDFGSGGALNLRVYNHTSGSASSRYFTGTVHVKNTYARSFTGSAGLSSSVTNASDDANLGALVNWSATNFTSITTGSEDLDLPGSGSGLYNAGTNLSTDPDFAFSDDGYGNTRSGTWDIGYHEHGASGGADTTLGGTGLLAVGVAGALSTSITPSASVSAAVTTQASLSTSITLAAAATLSLAAAGAAQTAITPAGTAAGAAGASGSLSTAIRAAAAAQGTAQTAAALTTQITLAASVTVSLAAAGALDGAALLAGAVTGAAAAAGALGTSIQATGAAQATATGAASLTTAITLVGAAPLTAQAQAAFEELMVPAAERTRAIVLPWRTRARVTPHSTRARVVNG